MLYNTTICYIVDHGHSEKIITSSHLILVSREKNKQISHYVIDNVLE